MEKCGPRNIKFGEHFEYIAQSMLYSQINVMTKKLIFTTVMATKEDKKKMYAATQLNGILLLLLRATLELKKVPLEELYQDYVANAKRDAAKYRQKEPSTALTARLFRAFYLGINDDLDELADLAELADEKQRNA
jgi:hypothetical protein